MATTWVRGPLMRQVMTKVTGADGRAIFTFDPPFPNVPLVLKDLLFATAAGCTVTTIGDVTKTSVTVEVRKPKALALGLVGVAHEVAPGVTVQIKAEQISLA